MRSTIIFLITVFTFFAFAAQLEAATFVTDGAITWTFAADYEVGQFAGGDYYVVDPGSGVSIIDISPGESSGKNGSMLNPSPNEYQGYDVSASNYDESLNVGIGVDASSPLVLSAGDMLISTISETDDARPWLDFGAILTVLSGIVPESSFRPSYCDTERRIYSIEDLNYDLLNNFEIPSEAPSLSSMEAYFENPWISHQNAWYTGDIQPVKNLPNYGREIALIVGEAGLALQLDYSQEDKEGLLVDLVQVGIDWFGVAKNAPNDIWENNGGIFQGRKFPILFTGMMLQEDEIKTFMQKTGDYILEGEFVGCSLVAPSDYFHFAEDDQTFYVTQTEVDITNSECWDPDTRAVTTPYTFEMIGMPEWAVRHGNRTYTSNSYWDSSYRRSSNGTAWAASLLTARLIPGMKEAWNHDVLFEYMDRYVAISDGDPDPFGYSVPGEEAGVGLDRYGYEFERYMWDNYRNYVPENIVIRADVNQDSSVNSSDALLVLRRALNRSMSGTSWQSSVTTGDVNCDDSVTTVDALLLLREHLGIDNSSSGWCGG